LSYHPSCPGDLVSRDTFWQVIKANASLTTEHYTYFMYQLLAGLAHMHSANVFHRDLKPKNILANANCKLKICDFGLARPSFEEQSSTIFWTDYVATRWYPPPNIPAVPATLAF
jgi:mitogen-activated protein kinase 1/3